MKKNYITIILLLFFISSNSQEKKYVNFGKDFIQILKNNNDEELNKFLLNKRTFINLWNNFFPKDNTLTKDELEAFINLRNSQISYAFNKIKIACINQKINLKNIKYTSVKELEKKGEIEQKTYKIFFTESNNNDYFIKLTLLEVENNIYIFEILNFNISK